MFLFSSCFANIIYLLLWILFFIIVCLFIHVYIIFFYEFIYSSSHFDCEKKQQIIRFLLLTILSSIQPRLILIAMVILKWIGVANRHVSFLKVQPGFPATALPQFPLFFSGPVSDPVSPPAEWLSSINRADILGILSLLLSSCCTVAWRQFSESGPLTHMCGSFYKYDLLLHAVFYFFFFNHHHENWFCRWRFLKGCTQVHEKRKFVGKWTADLTIGVVSNFVAGTF